MLFLYVLSLLFSGVAVNSWIAALVAALVMGLINVTIKPLAQLISLPITVLTLGFFYLVINALMLLLVGWLVPGVTIGGFWTAFFAAIVLSILNAIFGLMED